MPAITLHQLPMDVLAIIMQYLHSNDILNVMLSCKTLKNLIMCDGRVWKSIRRTRLLIQEHRKNKISGQSWYERCRVSHNWCKGRFNKRNVIFHYKNYMPWLKFHNSENLLITVGSDLHCYPIDKNGLPNGSRLQWKLSMPKLRQPDKRTDDISRFILKENLLVCGNRNGSVAVYRVDTLGLQPERIQYINKCYLDGAIEVSAVEIINTRDNAYLVTGSTGSPLMLFWNWGNDCSDLSRGGDKADISFRKELVNASKETVKCLALNNKGDKLAIGPDGNSRPVLLDINRISGQSWYERCRVSHNWCKGRFNKRNVIFHYKNYMPWLKFHNSENLLITVGSDLHCYPIDKNGLPNGSRLQWKLSMPKLRQPDKRTDDISRFILKENLLVCGNRNGSVAVYRVDTLGLQPERIQYINKCYLDGAIEVSAVEIINTRDNAYLVTGSTGSPLMLFWNWGNDCSDLSRGGDKADISFRKELVNASKETVKCLALNNKGDKLAIGPDGNSRPVLLDINRVEFSTKSEETSNASQVVQDLQWHDDNSLCYVTHSGSLQIMDVRTQTVVYDTVDPFQASFYCVKTDGNCAIVAGTSQHSRCVLYDTRKPQNVQVYFTQDKWKMSPIYSLDFDSSKIIAAAARGVAAVNFDVHNSTIAKDYSGCTRIYKYMTA